MEISGGVMKSVLFIFTLLNLCSGYADELAESQSYLSNAQKEEIQQKASAEAMDRELRRQKEMAIRYKQDIDKQAYAVRQSIESLRNEQKRYASQIESMKRETAMLQSKEQQLKKDVERAEAQARSQQAEALQMQSQIEATQNRLKESNQALEERRQKAAHITAEAREKVAKWTTELATSQAEIVKSQMLKQDIDKEISGVEIQISDLLQKQDSMNKELQMVREQVSGYTNEVNDVKKKKEQVGIELAATEKAREQVRSEFKNITALHQTQTKEFNDSITKLESAKKMSEQEKIQLEIEKKRVSESLQRARQKNEEAHTSLIKSENETLQSQLAVVEEKSMLTKEIVRNSGVLEESKKNKSSKLLEAVVVPKPEQPKEVPQASVPEVEVQENTAREVSSEGNWRLIKLCNLYAKPNNKSTKLFKIPEGQILKVEKGPVGFIKAKYKNQTGYVLEVCGQDQI